MRPLKVLVGALALGAAPAACGDDDDSVAITTSTVTAADQSPTCDEWTNRPVRSDEAKDGCWEPFDVAAEGSSQAGMAVFDCDDGRTIFFGDAGWGYVGEPMRPLEGPEYLPPQAERDACGMPPVPPSIPPPPLPD
jgi:hypothetical protein